MVEEGGFRDEYLNYEKFYLSSVVRGYKDFVYVGVGWRIVVEYYF